MQAKPPQRPQPERAHTEGQTPAQYRHNHNPGDYTPEVSPLDQFIYRGRMLKKELQHGERGAQPRAQQRAHSARTDPIGEDEDLAGHSLEPVELRMPRFSTITNDSLGDRDSMYSNDRDSSIMGGFSFGFNGGVTAPPAVQSALKTPQQEFTDGRNSVRPVLSHSQMDEEVRHVLQPQIVRSESGHARESVTPILSSVDDEFAPHSKDHLHDVYKPRQKGGMGGPRVDRRPSPGPHLRAHPPAGRGRGHPRVKSQQPPPREKNPLVRQASAGDQRPQPPRTEPAYTGRQYLPYRQNSGASNTSAPSPTSYVSPSESGRVPPPAGNSTGLQPVRQGSETSPGGYVAYNRQGSGDSLEVGPGIQRNSPSPQPQHMLMITGNRTASPDSTHSMMMSSPPNPWTMERSPSASSDVNSICSVGGTKMNKSLNFSRPLSSRPSMDSQHRPFVEVPSNLQDYETPMSPLSASDVPYEEGGTQSYVYTKFDLPRGREVGRDSAVFQESHPEIVALQQQKIENCKQPANIRAQPPTLLQAPPRLAPAVSPPGSPGTPGLPLHFPFPENHSLVPHKPANTPISPPPKPPRVHVTLAANLTLDEHLEKGISMHENGSLQESTYHLRCAAHGGHPTGMLLYALACRHGWGMRANQKEGVNWLKKVTQLASDEVADDENGITNSPFLEKQGRRAQFALSIYELGVSHLNGWGTEMDKGLALNCFEIAGSEFFLCGYRFGRGD